MDKQITVKSENRRMFVPQNAVKDEKHRLSLFAD
jgi:hypothetical protein